MRQFLTSGSARGVRSNLHPYRDRLLPKAASRFRSGVDRQTANVGDIGFS